MASDLLMTNVTQNNTSYSFVTPVKLDHNNFILRRVQILASIKGNGLEGFINGDHDCPKQYIQSESSTRAGSSTNDESKFVNPEFITWMKTDQILLSSDCYCALHPLYYYIHYHMVIKIILYNL